MLELKRHKQFKKDMDRIELTDTQYAKFINYISALLNGDNLPPEARDHPLIGNWKGFREFHIGGDLIVIYKKEDNKLILVRIGTHSQLFK